MVFSKSLIKNAYLLSFYIKILGLPLFFIIASEARPDGEENRSKFCELQKDLAETNGQNYQQTPAIHHRR